VSVERVNDKSAPLQFLLLCRIASSSAGVDSVFDRQLLHYQYVTKVRKKNAKNDMMHPNLHPKEKRISTIVAETLYLYGAGERI
jgi:hypothetical protein